VRVLIKLINLNGERLSDDELRCGFAGFVGVVGL
jgi:hypothetical protein